MVLTKSCLLLIMPFAFIATSLMMQEKYGHAQVPIGWEENSQLSNWVSTQRQEYKLLRKGRSSRLTNDRIKLLDNIGFVWEAQRGGPRRRRSSANSGGSSEDASATGEGSMAQNAAAAAATIDSSSVATPESPRKKRQRDQHDEQQSHSRTGVIGRSRMRGVLPDVPQRSAPAIHQAYALENLLAAQQQQDQLARLASIGGGAHPLSALELHAITSGRMAQLRQQAETENALRILASRGIPSQQQLPTTLTEAALAGLTGGSSSLTSVGGLTGSLAGAARPYNLDLMAQLQQPSSLLLHGGIDIGAAATELPATSPAGYAAAAARHQLSDLAGMARSPYGRGEQEQPMQKRQKSAELTDDDNAMPEKVAANRQEEIRNALLRESEFLRESSVAASGGSDSLRSFPSSQVPNMGLLGLLGSESARQSLANPLGGALPGTALDASRFQRIGPNETIPRASQNADKTGEEEVGNKPSFGSAPYR